MPNKRLLAGLKSFNILLFHAGQTNCNIRNLRPCVDGIEQIVLIRVHAESLHTIITSIGVGRIHTSDILKKNRQKKTSSDPSFGCTHIQHCVLALFTRSFLEWCDKTQACILLRWDSNPISKCNSRIVSYQLVRRLVMRPSFKS